MLKNGNPVGALGLSCTEFRAYSAAEIELVKTFADQAVIAIENVRLFTELEARNRDLSEALDRQTATAEILRVISSSPTDVQPVLDTIGEHAARLCGSYDAAVYLVHGDRLRLVAHHGPVPVHVGGQEMPLSREFVAGRTVIDHRPIHVDDLSTSDEFPGGRRLALEVGYRTVLTVPLLREGVGIGMVGIRRREVQPFTDKQTALLQTFAAQAVIAIENVRLFTALQASNRELTTALALEDHALRACYAAARMQEAVQRRADEPCREQGVTPRIRVGLNSSEVVVRAIGSDLRMEYTAVGQTTHLAARMEQLADPGSTLLTRETMALVEGFVQATSLGPMAVKGQSGPIEVY